MKAQSMVWREPTGWSDAPPWIHKSALVIYFGPTALLESGMVLTQLQALAPQAQLLGCSAGSQIVGIEVDDDTICAVALDFAAVTVAGKAIEIASAADSEVVGQRLANALRTPDLGAVLVLSDGLNVNGTRLIAGMTGVLGETMPLFGGLAGDGARFEKTLVGLNAPPRAHLVAAVGFYGSALRVSQAAAGGWDTFGPERRITAATGNVLESLDDKPALDLYERYLGEEAEGLPGTALLYPLCIWHDELHPEPQVRTVLSVDKKARTMTFAGDIPCGWSAQLMRGSHERLISGAAAAAIVAQQTMARDCDGNTLALMVSCVGRRMLMGSKTSEEAEAVADQLGAQVIKLGFYSYGEIAPQEYRGRCDLHNQTMTVALLGEATI